MRMSGIVIFVAVAYFYYPCMIHIHLNARDYLKKYLNLNNVWLLLLLPLLMMMMLVFFVATVRRKHSLAYFHQASIDAVHLYSEQL